MLRAAVRGGNKGFGLRAGTRHSFSRAFRKKGAIPLTTYLRTYKARVATQPVEGKEAASQRWARRRAAQPPAGRSAAALSRRLRQPASTAGSAPAPSTALALLFRAATLRLRRAAPSGWHCGAAEVRASTPAAVSTLRRLR